MAEAGTRLFVVSNGGGGGGARVPCAPPRRRILCLLLLLRSILLRHRPHDHITATDLCDIVDSVSATGRRGSEAKRIGIRRIETRSSEVLTRLLFLLTSAQKRAVGLCCFRLQTDPLVSEKGHIPSQFGLSACGVRCEQVDVESSSCRIPNRAALVEQREHIEGRRN